MPKINKYIDEELAAAESVSGTDKLLITQSGTPKAATITQVAGTVDLTGKADKVATSPAPTGYVATFDENGNLSVSAKEVSDLASKYPSDLELTSDTVVTEAQAITLHGTGGVLTNQGATGEVDVTLPAISYRVKFTILAEEAQVIEVGPPTDEVLYLNGTALDANDCVDSDGVEGSMIQAFRHKDSSGNWHWYLVTITGVWSDTGASD